MLTLLFPILRKLTEIKWRCGCARKCTVSMRSHAKCFQSRGGQSIYMDRVIEAATRGVVKGGHLFSLPLNLLVAQPSKNFA